MTQTKFQLPYFDKLIKKFSEGDQEALEAFGTHVHWGYWANVNKADGSIADFVTAAENLAVKVYNAAKIQENQSILDTGCGFGGTIASINHSYSHLKLTGLNIDERQLERARKEVIPVNNNTIEFVTADACQMPFENAIFDNVLAVECIFHFPSREKYFQEARRVIKTGGRLAISDFVPVPWIIPIMRLIGSKVNNSVIPTYGQVDSTYTIADYQKLAQNSGFKMVLCEDITFNTLPTYPIVKRLFRQMGTEKDAQVTAQIEWFTRLGLLRYLILAFEAI